SQATGEIKDGVVVATSEDAKVYEDALVNDIKQQSAANGEEIAGATISTKSLNLTNVNADSYSVSFDNNSWSTNLKSEGQDITTSIVAGDILGKLADGTVVFKVELDKSAATEYTFTLFKPLDHADADGHNELNLVFGYTVTAGTATISKTFNVAVVDSVPDLDGVTHTHNEDSSASANKLILADEFRPTDGTSSLTIAGEDLTANASSVKINASGIAVTDGSEIGTIVSDGDGGVTFEPKNDYSGTVSVAYTITDSDGDTATSNLVFDTKPKVDFIAPTLNDLEVNEDARDEDKVEDITASALVLDVPNIANLLATGTGANYDDDRSESVGDIIVKGIPDGATLYVDGVAVVLVDDGATNKYTISGFDPSTNVLSIIPPADSDADFTITYNFTVTDTATLSTGEDTDTKDYSIDQKIIVHGVADNVSIDAVLNNITQAEQALNNVSSSWMNVSDIISKSDLTFGDSSDKSEAHLIRIDGLPSGAYYSHSGNLNSSGVDLTGAAGNNTSNMFKGSSSSYYRVIDNGDGTSSLIISAENYLDGAGTEGKLRFPDVDGTFNITVTAVAVEKEFVEAEGSDWYDSVTWDANDGNTAGGTHVDDKIGFEVSEAKNSTITVTKSMDVEVKGVETSEDTEVSFLSKVNITDASDEDFSSIKILTSSLGGATITSGSVTIDGLYTVINDLNDLSSYKLIPPAHSSTDLNLSLEVITTDGTATYTLPIKVTPVAEKVGVDSDGDGSNDLTMNIDHTYAAKGSEDSRFDLGSKFASENGNSFESYWSNEDDSDLTNNTLSQTNSEYTYAKLTAGDSTNLVGAKFIYTDSLGVEHTKVVTSNVAGVNISVEFLDSLVFIAPAGSNGTFNIKMEAYTIDHDEDDGATKTQTSGQAILTLEVDPGADIATIKTTQAKGFEDAGRDASGATSEALALSGGIDLNVTFFTSDKDGSESFDVTLSDIPNGAVIYYNGAILTPVAGTINIVNFDNDAEFKYVPTHNSNEDVTLKVTGETVDNRGQANEDRQAFTPKDIVVNIKGVADNVVDNDLNATTAVVDTDGTSHDYHYVAKEDAGNISLTDIFAGTPHSYDSDGSESLFITITNLGTDFDVSGAVFLGGSGTGREWVVNSNDFAGVSISKPANYSGEIDLKLGFQTVENDGSKKTHPSKDVNILVTPEIDGNVNKTATQNEDTIQTLSFNFSNGGDANESLEALQIDMDSVDNGVTLYSDGVEITANGWIDVTGVITATIPADSDTDYDFAIRYKMSDTTDDSTSYTDKSISDNSYDSTDTSWTLDTYMVDVKAVTDTATSSITLASDDTDKATVSGDDTNGYTLTVDKTNTTFDVGFKLTSDDVASEANSADDDGSEKVVSITISGVPEGVSIVGGTYAGDKLVNVGGTATIINSGSWTLAVTDAMLDADGALNNIGFMVVGEKVNFNNITTTGNIKITVGHQDGSSTTLTNSENFDFVVDGGFNGDSGVLKNDTAIQMDLALVSNSTQLREDTSFTLDSLVTANDGTTNGDSSKFAILISDLPTGYTISGVSDQTVTIDGVKYYAAYGDGDVTDVNTLLSNISVTPASNENTLVTEKVDFKIEVRTSISEENSDGAHQKSYSVDGKAGGFDAELAPVSDATTIGISGSDVAESATPAEQTITLDLSNSADGDRVVIKDGTLYVKFTESYTDGDAATKGTITYNGVDVSTLAVEDGYYKITGVSNDLNADNIIFKYTPPANHYGTLKIDSKIISSENPNPEKDLSGADYTTTQETTLATKTINVTPVNDGLSNLSLTSSTGLEDGMAELVLNVGALSDSTESISSITLQNIPYGYVVYYGADENNVSKATTSKLVGRDANGDYIYNITIPVDADGTLPDYIGVTAPIADKIGSDVDISDAKLVVVSGEGGSGKTQIVENINITWTAVADGLINMDPTNAIGDELSDVAINVNANVKDVDGSEIFTMTLKGLGVDASFKEAGVDATSVVYDASNDTYTISNISYENVNSITFVQKAFTGDVDVTLQSRESSNGDTSVVSTGSFTATVSAASATAGDDELLYYSGKDIDGLGGNDTLVMWPGQDINFNALGGDTFANIEKIDLGANGNHEISNLSLDDIMTITNGDASNHHDLTIVGDNGDSIRDVEFDIGTNDTQWTETGDMTDKVFEYSKNDGSASITLTV
ncbi:MAG: hypothetical protein GQ474_05760, partial [Sulfurimonas sp.]|nr:hypothetical protein [Sulfurimonas sp.]